MLKGTAKLNRVSITALFYVVMGFLCAAIILLASFSTVKAGTLQDAKDLGTEFEQTITDKTPSPNADQVISMTFLRDSVFSGSTFDKTKFDEFIKTYTLADTVITLSTPRELLMFSAYCNGVEISDYAPTSINTTLMNHLLSSRFVLADNINYVGNGKYYLDSADLNNTVTVGKAGGIEAYTSNGIYDGYFGGSLIVPNYFMPVQNFKGSFDGQNFEISNLLILRNAKQNSLGLDAMFASVSTGGTVKNFGLVDAEFKRHNTYSNNTTVGGGDYPLNPAAAIVGKSEGTVSYVYAVNTKLETTAFNIYDAYSLPAVLNGTISEYYVGLTNGFATYDAANTNYTPTAVDSFGKRWYRIGANGENEAVFDNYFTAKYSAYPRLSGFKADLRISGESYTTIYTNAIMHEILRPADFINMSRLIMEKGTERLWFRLVNDLDFRLVSEYAYISATALNKTTSVILFSDHNLVGNGDGTFDTPFIYDNSLLSKTISNLKISSYLKKGNETAVGLFNQLTDDGNNDFNLPFEFFNLNFIACEAVPPAIDSGSVYVGFLAGIIRNGICVANTMVNATIAATDYAVVGGETYYGGMVGSFISANSRTPFANGLYFNRAAFNGTVYGGIRSHSNTASFYTAFGGIIGRTYPSTANNFDTVNVSGDITGIYPVASGETVKNINICVGGLMGYGKLGSNYFGVYISDTSVISNFPIDCGGINSKAKENYEIYLGGLVGRDTGDNGITTFDAVGVDADLSLRGEYLTLTDNNGAPTSDTTINIKAYYGGIAGGADTTFVNKDGIALYTANFFGGKFVMPAKALVDRYRGFELFIGNLFGGVNNTKIYNIVNDKNLVLDFNRANDVEVGGLVGVRIGGSSEFTNCHNAALVQLNMYSNDSLSYASSTYRVNFNVGGVAAADAKYVDCSNMITGTVKISVDVIAGGGAHTKVFGVGSHGTFYNCVNAGLVIYEAKSGGGNNISASGISNTGTLDDCENTSSGKVSIIAKGVTGGTFYNAGITYGGRVKNSRNFGIIHFDISNATGGNAFSSGIVSSGANNMNDDNDYTVEGCVNGVKGGTTRQTFTTTDGTGGTTKSAMSVTVSGIAYGGNRTNINNCVNYAPIVGVATTGTQYYSGISRQSGSVSQSSNYGDIALGNYDITSAIYIAGIGNELMIPKDWQNNVYGSIAMTDNTNYGNISVASFRRNLFIGGIFNYTQGNANYSLVNFGKITATSGVVDSSTAQIHVGGIFSHTLSTMLNSDVSNSFNFGDINVSAVFSTHNAHGSISAGGILGGNDGYNTGAVATKNTLYNCINTANITLTVNNLNKDVNNYYTYGAGGILGVAYNRNVSTNDDYYLNDCVNSGVITYADISAYASVYERGGGAGGIIGNVNCLANEINVTGSLNYGAVISTTNAGGIIGVNNANTVIVSNAINYGAIGQINTVNAGGVFGRNESGSVSLNNSVNYGVLISKGSSGGIAAKNNSGTLSLNKAVYIDSTLVSNKLVGSGSSAYLDAYYASDSHASSEAGVTSKTLSGTSLDPNWIYSDNFMWGTNKLYTTTNTVVWSEKAYKASSGYHAPSISDANPHCFAVTKSFGTEKGEYLGNDYTLPTVIDGGHKTIANAKLADLKQISISRDTFYTYSNKAEHELQLIDSGKGTIGNPNDKMYLPTPLYNEDSNTFTSVIRPSSTYYGNNHGAGGFVYDGANTDVMSHKLNSNVYGDWSLAFSKNAKSIWKKGETKVFNSAQEGMPTLINIATFYLIVYQSDITVADDPTKSIAEMEAMLDISVGKNYYTRYTVKVYFFNEADPTFIPDSSVTDPFTYDNNSGTINLDSAAENVTNPSGEESLLEYKLETKQDKAPVTVNWDKGIFKGIFAVNGIEERSILDNGVFELIRVKDIYGNAVSDSAVNLKNFPNIFTLITNIAIIKIPDIEEELSTSSGTITVTVKFTEFNVIDEIKSGSYKLVIKLPKAFLADGSVDYLERVIAFTKEMSGDTYLKYGVASGGAVAYNNKIANGEPNIDMRARFTAYSTSNPDSPANSIPGRNYLLRTADNKNVNFVDIASTDTVGGRKVVNYSPLRFDMDWTYFGTMPALPKRDGGITASFSDTVTTQNPINFYNIGANNRLVINPFASFIDSEGDKLDIEFNRRADGTYTITYSFTVVAENGDKGKYSQVYNFNTLPPMEWTADDPDSLAPDGKTISVGRTSSGTVSATYKNALHNIPSFIGLTDYKLYIADADNVWKISTDPMFDGLLLPVIGLSGDKVLFTYERETLGGKYSVAPSFSPKFYVPLQAYPDMVSFNDEATPPLDSWLNPFTLGDIDSGVIISKEASKNSHLRDLVFTNPPTGAKFAYVANNTYFPINESQTIVGDALALNYGNSRQPDPNTGERFNNFRLQLNYNEDGSAGSDETEYSTYMTILIKRWDKLPSLEQDIYNDEFVTIYSRSGGSLGAKLNVYKDDPASDFIEYRIYVSGGSVTGVRVYAENTLFYTDYDFVTDGPVMNKTFNLTVNAPEEASGLFVVSLKTIVNGRYTRTTNVLFLAGAGGGDIAADLVTDGSGVSYYTKTYRLTRNTAATYEATAIYPMPGYYHKLTKATLLSGSGNVILTTDLLSNKFTLTNNDAASVELTVDIFLNADYKPPWGVGI